MRASALCFWVLLGLGGGIAGVLVDADHIPQWIFGVGANFVPFNIFEFDSGRF